MESITGYTLRELRDKVSQLGMESYRANQILRWIYKKKVTDFELMTDLPRNYRLHLREIFSVCSLKLIKSVEAPSAVKYLFKTKDDHLIETVLIKERDHLTLCVSSQIGCAVGCKFCATALDGLKRNLKTEEIVDQFLQVQLTLKEHIRNVVFMGMGEPLANYDNVRKAVEIMISPWGFDLSKRRVTLSTSGLLKPLCKMRRDPLLKEINLAVSINAPFQELREEIMPLSEKNDLEELMKILREFPLPKYRRITLEYVLIKDLNDSPSMAKALADLIGKSVKRFKVNLIPYNPDPFLPYERPSLDRIMEFQRILWSKGISTFVRFSKGVEVFGACGQLRHNRNMLKSHFHESYSQMANGVSIDNCCSSLYKSNPGSSF